MKTFSWFRLCIALSLLLFSISFLTPFPADIIRAFKGESIIIANDDSSLDEITDLNDSPDNTSSNDDRLIDTANNEDISPIPLPDDRDVTPPPVDPTPPIDPSTEPGDLSQLKPFRFNASQPNYSLNFPPLPQIIPDGPSEDAIWDVNELARGLSYKTQLNFKNGALASKERANKRNYELSISLDIVQPSPLSKPEEFRGVNPHLSSIFKNFDSLIKAGKVSGFYHQLLQRKQIELRNNLLNLGRILTRHNYYDCETILEITAPGTGRKVLWIQADMDVVSDGTDGDRLPQMPASIVNSQHYQPFTSYRWTKQTKNQNPLLPTWEKKLKVEQAKKLSAQRNRQATAKIQSNIDYIQRAINDLKNSSFLIAEYDPFIVIPLGILNNSRSAFSPSPGDYAVVIYGKKLYPAIVGDAGPRYKIGEASLRIAKEIDPNSSPYKRPVSDLTVSYVVFPNSADPVKKAPDLALWKTKCEELLNELGGISPGYSLHDWEDLLAPKTEPSKNNTALPPSVNKPNPPTSTARPALGGTSTRRRQ